MANLFPLIFPHSSDSPEMKKLGIQIEFEVYTKLGSTYDKTVDVVYGPQFIRENLKGQIRDGEFTDFLIIHPKMGILFLECKGGRIEYKSNERKWYQNDKLLKQSPIDQAKFGKNSFVRFLKKKNINTDNIPTLHGVIFPNTPKIDGELPPDIKPEMIIWSKDFAILESSLNKLFNLYKRQYRMEKEEQESIIKILIGDNLKTPFKNFLQYGEHEQELHFEKIQQQFISSVFENSKLIVKGLAGTGKTIIAAKVATKEKYKDKKVLMLTKTKGLCQFLKVLIKKNPLSKSTNLRIYSIDNFVTETSKRLGLPRSIAPQSPNEKREHFDNYNPQRCQQIFDTRLDEKFDLLIVDEGQDFHKNWFDPLNSIVKDDGSIFFLYDPLQTTIPNSMVKILEKPNEIGFSICSFNANYRNTSSISNLLSKLIKKYFPNEKLEYSEHSKVNKGRKPELIEANNFEDIIKKTIEKVKYLINKEKFKPMDIGVLGVDSMMPRKYGTNLSMTAELKKLNLKVIGAWDYSVPYLDPKEVNDITFSDVRSFKGLEKSVIILVNFAELNEKLVQQIYTGLSRARGDLIVVSNTKSINQIKELF